MSDTFDVNAYLRDEIAKPESRPHCFRAWVQGAGYVNDGNRIDTADDYRRQYLRAAEIEIDSMAFSPAYAERGYTQPRKGVLLADWNTLPAHVTDRLESEGYAIEWSDEWDSCDDCLQCFRTQPDSYDWTPSGSCTEEHGSLCLECRQNLG